MKGVMFWAAAVLMACVVGCRKGPEEAIVAEEIVRVTEPAQGGRIAGMYLLNEGPIWTNKASIDYFDCITGLYHRGIFAPRNPHVVYELGDVGNDLQIYRGRLYAVINNSGLVEVMDARTARHIGVVWIRGCRYIAFEGDKGYVSSYTGDGMGDSRRGKVTKIDLATLTIEATTQVGREPEQMVTRGGTLYVANSGGYAIYDRESTVSVVDLESFKETGTIEVALNLHHMALAPDGGIWVSSRGDYEEIKPALCLLDPATGLVAASFDLSVGEMTLRGERLYICPAGFGGNTNQFAVVDTATRTIVDECFIKDGSQGSITTPYGVAVNPETGEIFVTDAKKFTGLGTLRCYDAGGTLSWEVMTGYGPAHMVFLEK